MQKKTTFPDMIERSNFLAPAVFSGGAKPDAISGDQVYFGLNGSGQVTIYHRSGDTVTDLLAVAGGVTMSEVIVKIGELAAAKNHTHNSAEIAWTPSPVLPGEYYLIRRETYTVGCLRTDQWVDSGDPENPMPDLVSTFSAPKVIPVAVTYRTAQNNTSMPMVIDPDVVEAGSQGFSVHVESKVMALNGALSSWPNHESANNYGVYLMSLSPELFWDFGEQAYIIQLHIKKTVGGGVGMIEYAEQLKLLAGDPITGEPHLLPEDLGLHEDEALAFWTSYYPTLGGTCPTYKVVEV